jgi:hypothetical protein
MPRLWFVAAGERDCDDQACGEILNLHRVSPGPISQALSRNILSDSPAKERRRRRPRTMVANVARTLSQPGFRTTQLCGRGLSMKLRRFDLRSGARRLERRRPAGLPTGLHGGAKRSRTADLLNAIQALYQLSYSPEVSGLPGDRGSPGRRGTYSNTLMRSTPAFGVFRRGRPSGRRPPHRGGLRSQFRRTRRPRPLPGTERRRRLRLLPRR